VNAANRFWNKWGIFILAVAFVFIAAGYDAPTEPLTPPAFWVIALIGTAVIVYSSYCCGSDHEEGCDIEHPDGRMTYPKFSIGKLGWWREKEEEKHVESN